MGISASYISQDGGARLFDLEGAPEPGSVAAGLLGAHVSRMQLPQMGSVPLAMPDVPSMSNEPEIGKVTEQNLMEVLHRVLPPVGEIVSDGYALHLRGAEGGVPGGNVVYGSLGGAAGFFPLSQIDPGGGGTVLNGAGDRADGTAAQMNGTQGATIRLGGRTVAYIDKTTEGFFNWLVEKNYYRLAQITPNGRIASISGEFEELVCRTYIPQGGAGGGGMWGVRPVKNRNGQVTEFLFGASSDLGSESDNVDEIREKETVTSVKVLTCPGGA